MTVWEISGTEMFICIDKAQVLVLRNDIWSQSTKQEYEEQRSEFPDFSRHSSKGDFLEWMKFGTYPED